MFVQINHYFSPFVKLLSASRTNVGKTKIPHSPAKFFNACETRNSFCRSLSSVDFADQSAAEKLCDKLRRLGKWLFRVARNGVQHVWTCAGGRLWKIANAPLVTLLRVNFLSRIISYYDVLTTMPYLTSPLGQMDFCTIYNDNC